MKNEPLYTSFEAVITKLPHSKVRVPYTYHHDHLRTKVRSFASYSRSDIAALKSYSQSELYAVALAHLVTTVDPIHILSLDQNDSEICKQAIQITDSLIKEYDSGK